jgi:Tfp pilus assembly PilM family ATPase
MRKHDKRQPTSAVGIHLGREEIRIVEAAPHENGLRVLAAGSVGMTAGYLDSSSAIATTGQAIKALIERTGIKNRNVFLGVPPSYSVTRVIEVPPMPDEEVSVVLYGELQHHRLLSEEGGGMDWQRLVSESGQEACLVLAADSQRLWHLEDCVDAAKLHPQTTPVHSSLIRAASMSAPSGDASIVVSIGSESCEAAIVQGEKLYAYRRIDILGSRLIQMGEEDHDQDTVSSETTIEPYFAERLTSEISRLLEFLRRLESPGDQPRIILTGTDSRYRMLSGFIEEAIGAETRYYDMPLRGEGRAAALLDDEVSRSKFAAAAAVAWAGLEAGESAVGTFILEAPEQRVHQSARSSGSPAPFLVVAAAIGLACGFMWFGNTRNAENLEEGNAITQDQIDVLDEQVGSMNDSRQDAIRALAYLSELGVPFPPMVDRLSSMLNANIGVKTIDFEPDGRISIAGEALSEDQIVETVDRLNFSPDFYGTFVDSYTDKEKTGLVYRMTTRFVMTLPEEIVE